MTLDKIKQDREDRELAWVANSIKREKLFSLECAEPDCHELQEVRADHPTEAAIYFRYLGWERNGCAWLCRHHALLRVT